MKKRIKKRKINFFKVVILLSAILSLVLLIHDFIFWGIVPLFTGHFIQLTYFGFFLDLIAIGVVEMAWQLIME
jgi:hypothetical protein